VKEKYEGDTVIPLEHVIYSPDAMPRDIMCYADDTPRPRRYQASSSVAIKVVGELRRCRDWSALETWAKERLLALKLVMQILEICFIRS
jgi:hypothetical protein